MSIEIIIPAYNEARTVGTVVTTARHCPLVDRVHVVDDGSGDRTGPAAHAAGAVVHALSPNQGKTAALLAGARECQSDIVVLLDADLIGLEERHIEALAGPILRGEAGMTIGVFHDGRWITDLSQRLTPFLNGQRALRRELLWGLEDFVQYRYAADTLLSLYAGRIGVEVRMVPLHGLTHVMKEEKVGFLRGFGSRMSMFYQVLRAFRTRLPDKGSPGRQREGAVNPPDQQ